MNQKGLGLRDFILIVVIIFIILFLVSFLYRRIFVPSEVKKTEEKDQSEKITKQVVYDDSYSDMESRIRLAAERYQNDNYQGDFESKEIWILDYKMLLKEEYLKNKLIDIKDNSECNGYVEFNKNGALINYYPYIKCSNYTTKGYDASKAK